MSDTPNPQVHLEAAADRVEAISDSNWRLMRWLVPVLFVIGVAVIGLILVVRQVSDNVDRLDQKVTVVGEQTQEVKSFVDELKAPPSAEEQRQNQAVSEAVRLVPEIRSILCEQFPQASACQ